MATTLEQMGQAELPPLAEGLAEGSTCPCCNTTTCTSIEWGRTMALKVRRAQTDQMPQTAVMLKQSFQTVCLLCLCHLAVPDGMLPVVNELCVRILAVPHGMLPVVDELCVCLLVVPHGMLQMSPNELCKSRGAPTCSTLIGMCISLSSQQLMWLSFGWQGLRQSLIPELIARSCLRTGMHETGCSGETRLVLHVPSSS